jgi:hypothetical protein
MHLFVHDVLVRDTAVVKGIVKPAVGTDFLRLFLLPSRPRRWLVGDRHWMSDGVACS